MAVKVLVGEALETLRTLPDQSVNCIVTSPPYYGLRDYGTATWEGGDPECEHTTDGRWYTEKTASLSSSEAFFEAGPDNAARLKKGRWREKGACTKCGAIHADDQIGLEETPEEFVAKLVAVFREARRVLRDDGVAFINIGDSYAGSGRGAWNVSDEVKDQKGVKETYRPKVRAGGTGIGGTAREAAVTKQAGEPRVTSGLKAKDLIGIPWMLATALRAPYYTGKIKDERDRVWLAAIIDGEGCFFIHKRKAGSRSYSKFERADGTTADYTRTQDTFGAGLEISNTSKAIIDRVASIVPGGTYTEQTPEQNNNRRQVIYRWRLAPNAAKALAQELYPHLVAKQRQARLLFNCPSTGEAAAAAHQAMMDMHRGIEPDVDYPAPPSLFEPGWYLRQEIIWAKSNPMPESVRDRCTKSHEHVFLLSKSQRYLFDAEAISEAVAPSSVARLSQDIENQTGSERVPGKTNGNMKAVGGTETRNKRDVWTIATEPSSIAHYAMMPTELAKTCIMAGCPLGGTVLDMFGGAGTTGLVADRLQRSAILIELSPEHAGTARERLQGDMGMFGEIA